MTEQEFDKLPWQFVSHTSMADMHCTVYECKEHHLTKCVRVPWDERTMAPAYKGRTTVHYMFANRVFKSKRNLLKYLNQ